MDGSTVRLSLLAHGGGCGCGCKLDSVVLRGLLADQPMAGPFERLFVGNETSDDAATNAISDIYAMGGKPIMALAILGMPVGRISSETVAQILKGGASLCAESGIPVAGGHSINTPEPIYGLAVIGTCRREEVRRNADARAGDALILTKPLSVGVYSAAIRREVLPAGGYAEFLATTARLNRISTDLARDPEVHAITDVTGLAQAQPLRFSAPP